MAGPSTPEIEPVPIVSTKDFAGRRPPLDHHDSPDERSYHSDTTATNSSDEFDWEEDDDDKKADPASKRATRGRALHLAFMKLARPIRVFIIGILGGGILIAPLLVFNLRFRTHNARPHVHMWSFWLSVTWAAGCITYLVIDALPRFITGLVNLFGGQVERLKLQLELTLAVSAWIKTALDITWGWASLSILRVIYKPPGNYWPIVNRVMQGLFAAGIILLVEKIFLQFVAINFHQKALADRLAENRLGLKALDRLSNTQPVSRRGPYGKRGHKSPSASMDFHTLPKGQAPSPDQGTKPEKKARGNKKRKAIPTIIVDQLGEAIGQVALKDSKFNKEADLGGLYSARRLARKLFSTLSDVYPPRKHLIVEDFEPYFRSTTEAHDAFAVFDKDGNGDISKKEMREAVQRIYRERKALIASMKDAGSAIAKLDAVLLTVALVIIIFVCLLIFNRENTLASLVPMATIILGFSFIFGHSAQTLFESLIFIFSTHVFDVGDLVIIDDQPLFVKEFGLFSTTFRRVDGQEIIAPNALLANTKLVHNLRRSNSMWESTMLTVSYNTPMEVIEQLKGKVSAYINENSREWSNFAVNIDRMEFQNALHLSIAVEHRPNWQDWGGRWARRTAFMRHLKTSLEALDIRYTMPVQPVSFPRGMQSLGLGAPPMPSAMGSYTSAESLGNAGHFQGSPISRAPGHSLSPGISTF